MKAQHLVQWFRQMAVLLQCGIPAMEALDVCARQTTSPQIVRAGEVILNELRVGQRLSQGMRVAGPPFHPVYWGAVEVGEMEGDIAVVFCRLAELAEESDRVKRRLVSALAYPALVLSVSALGMYLLIRFLAPVLADVGEQLQQQPNAFSQAMLWLGKIFEHEFLTLAVAVMLGFGVKNLARYLWTRRRLQTERLLFRTPLLGKMLRFGVLIRICQTMETVIGGGLPLTEALNLTARTCGSELYAQLVLLPAVERIRYGESLQQSLAEAPGLPASFRGLVVAGEESGRLDHTFGYLAHLYEIELVTAVESFLAGIEPLAIAVVGVVVLGVLLSVFAPLSKLLTAV